MRSPSQARRIRLRAGSLIAVLSPLVVAAPPATAHPSSDVPSFAHVGTFDVRANPGSQVAEIVSASTSGRTLIYTDSASQLIGFVDISDPSNPQPDGTLPVAGEPTSVAVKGGYALAAVNTSTTAEVTCDNGTPDDPSDDESVSFISRWLGRLTVIDIDGRAIVRNIPLPGQPDSVAVSPDGAYAAVVIENERNESVGDGLIPQGRNTDTTDPCNLVSTGAPKPGSLVIVDLQGDPQHWQTRAVRLNGLPGMFAPSDPEPEFVDINDKNEAVVTLQENNHIAVVDLETGEVTRSFSAGAVDLTAVDATEEKLGPQEAGLIIFADDLDGRRREPDGVAWISKDLFVTANEGDYEDANGEEGGSRGFSVFDKEGEVEFDVGEDVEYASASAGHYNEGRSANKGGEPESAEYGRFRGHDLLFVGAERANIVGVYDLKDPKEPRLLQLLPTGIGPEGLLAIPNRNLVVAASETAETGIPSLITLYGASRKGQSTYPQLASEDEDGAPIPWVAMSGLAGDLEDRDRIYGVSDSFLANGFIYTIDVSGPNAVTTQRIEVTDPNGVTADWPKGFFPDFEGIAAAPEAGLTPGGGFWLASEGRTGDRPNAILHVNEDGEVLESTELPADLVAGASNSGFEGVAVSADGAYVYAVVQREWKAGADGVLADPGNMVKIARWDGASWSFVHYPLEVPAAEGWDGLSEITLLPDGTFAIVERDNQLGTAAAIKRLYGVDLAAADFRTDLTVPLEIVHKTLLADVLDELESNSIWTPDKLEGFSVAADGQVYLVTDNDGLDESLGQTVFLRLGDWTSALAGD